MVRFSYLPFVRNQIVRPAVTETAKRVSHGKEAPEGLPTESPPAAMAAVA